MSKTSIRTVMYNCHQLNNDKDELPVCKKISSRIGWSHLMKMITGNYKIITSHGFQRCTPWKMFIRFPFTVSVQLRETQDVIVFLAKGNNNPRSWKHIFLQFAKNVDVLQALLTVLMFRAASITVTVMMMMMVMMMLTVIVTMVLIICNMMMNIRSRVTRRKIRLFRCLEFAVGRCDLLLEVVNQVHSMLKHWCHNFQTFLWKHNITYLHSSAWTHGSHRCVDHSPKSLTNHQSNQG